MSKFISGDTVVVNSDEYRDSGVHRYAQGTLIEAGCGADRNGQEFSLVSFQIGPKICIYNHHLESVGIHKPVHKDEFVDKNAIWAAIEATAKGS